MPEGIVEGYIVLRGRAEASPRRWPSRINPLSIGLRMRRDGSETKTFLRYRTLAPRTPGALSREHLCKESLVLIDNILPTVDFQGDASRLVT